MRINIRIRANSIDIFYRHTILSLIKEILKLGDESYKKTLYKEKMPKPFTFSVFFFHYYIKDNQEIQISKKYKVTDKIFILKNGHFNVNLSTYDSIFFNIFIKGLDEIKNNDIIINDKVFTIEQFRIIQERKIAGGYVFFKTLSPFVINKKNMDKPKEYINNIMDMRLKVIRGDGLKQEITFIPLDIEVKKTKHTLRGIRDKYAKPYIYLNTMSGKFILKGHQDDLKVIYQAGFLNKASQGFGMLEVY